MDSADVNSAITGLEEATYAFFWNVMSECGSRIDTVFVTLSSLAEGGDDLVLCDDFPISTLGANPTAPTSEGRWSALNTGVEISNPSDPMASVINLNILSDLLHPVCLIKFKNKIKKFYILDLITHE